MALTVPLRLDAGVIPLTLHILLIFMPQQQNFLVCVSLELGSILSRGEENEGNVLGITAVAAPLRQVVQAPRNGKNECGRTATLGATSACAARGYHAEAIRCERR